MAVCFFKTRVQWLASAWASTAVAFGAAFRTSALGLPALITQQVIVIKTIMKKTNTLITTRTIIIELQRVPSEEDGVYWRRASRTMSEVVVIVIQTTMKERKCGLWCLWVPSKIVTCSRPAFRRVALRGIGV